MANKPGNSSIAMYSPTTPSPTTPSTTPANYSTRKPQRVTITVPYRVYEALVQESDDQGRSLSNLASVWLERQTLQSQIR